MCACLLLHFGRLETDFSADAEVCYHVKNDLLEHGVFGKFLIDIRLRVELVRVHRSEVHYVSYVEVIDPIVVVFDSESVSDVDLVSLVGLQVLNLANACKLGQVVMRLSLVKCQVLLVEFIGDPPELV